MRLLAHSKLMAFAIAATTLSMPVMWAPDAKALGQAPHHAPGEPMPAQYAVPGFEVPASGEAFHNYSHWDRSKLPEALQVAHCSGMALFARQVFNWASFDPSLPQASEAEYRVLLRKIYRVPTALLPDARARIVLPGYATWYEMTARPEIETIVKDLLGDALGDILRRNWNWSPIDVFGSTHRSRSLIELNIRETLSQNHVALLYLTDGIKTAHSVLAYGYEVQEDRVVYLVYDSNHPDEPTQMSFLFKQAKFDHPDLGFRDPWILHPYAGEFYQVL
jgi:hypothetical protein